MKLAPIYFYVHCLITFIIFSIPFWYFLPEFNYILLLAFIFCCLFGSTKDGEKYFNSNEKNDYYE